MDESQLFVVRVWPESIPFRASVRAVDREETRMFGQPADLLHFLCSAAADLPAISPPNDKEES